MSERTLIFLDIDGVLNRCGIGSDARTEGMIVRACVNQFNRLVREAKADVVLSSSWRYMIIKGAMELRGFGILLTTHRVRCNLIGLTPGDEERAGWSRGQQIRHWLNEQGDGRRYVVLDDDDDGISDERHPFVQTNGRRGLTVYDVRRAIRLLGA